MKVAMLGMKGEFNDMGSTSGIVKYISSLYFELGNMNSVQLDKVEYKKAAKRLPWANHSAFYFQSNFTSFKEYDLIHNPNSLRLFAKPKGAKLVTTNHDMLVTNMIKSSSGIKDHLVAMNSNLANVIGIRGLKMALESDNIITDTLQGKEELIQFINQNNLEYASKNITVIRLGIDSKFSTEKIHKKKNSKNFNVGYLGSFSAPKKVGFAIKAFKLSKDPSMRFEVWGKKTIEASLLEKEANEDKRIFFRGIAPEESKIKILDSFDVFVHTGVYESIMNYEALARGLPVIVWKHARLSPDLRAQCIEIEDEVHMAQVLEDIKMNGYSNKKRRKSIEYASKFSWHKTAVETLKVYKKVLQ